MRRGGGRRRSALPDIVGPGLRALFVGINPGLRSAAIGHHFAGHSNRFWKLLCESGLIGEAIGCEEDTRLPEWGFGVTNLIARATSGIDELRPDEYAAGRLILERKIHRHRPAMVALVGVTIHRALFEPSRNRPPGAARLGLRDETLGGAPIFLLPNPSGRNASISYETMRRAYVDLRICLERIAVR